MTSFLWQNKLEQGILAAPFVWVSSQNIFLLHVITDSGGYRLRTDYLLSATITRSGKSAGQILYIRRKKKMQPERKELGKKKPTYESNYSPTLTGLVP